MSEVRSFGFQAQLVISTGTSANTTIGAILMDVIPGSLRAIQALPVNDRQGVDWWIETASGENCTRIIAIYNLPNSQGHA